MSIEALIGKERRKGLAEIEASVKTEVEREAEREAEREEEEEEEIEIEENDLTYVPESMFTK